MVSSFCFTDEREKGGKEKKGGEGQSTWPGLSFCLYCVFWWFFVRLWTCRTAMLRAISNTIVFSATVSGLPALTRSITVGLSSL